MSRTPSRMLPAVLIALLAVPSGMALATPYFRIDTQIDWTDAYLDGRIQPVPGPEFQDMVYGDQAWPAPYQDAEFFTPTLYVLEGEHDGEAGLVMAWGPPETPAEPVYMAAAWDYVYPQDPNLKGTIIEFSIFPPVPSTLFSLNLIDGNGNYREWIWHAGGAGEVPPGLWSDLLINPATGWSNWPTVAPSPFIHDQPGTTFDLSSITILRFNENILWDPAFPPPPPNVWEPGGQGIPPEWLWNAWDHVAVTPEPATMLLLGGGLLALARGRRRRK